MNPKNLSSQEFEWPARAMLEFLKYEKIPQTKII